MADVLDFKKIKCSQDGCNVAVDGICLEGLQGEELKKCTFLKMVEEAEANNVESSSSIEGQAKENLSSVYSGDSLSLNETNTVTTSSLTRFVVLAGRAEAGKTTLLTSLFDLFQTNPSYAGYLFSGSRTLIGFEKICHPARLASKRSEPKTERTKYNPDDSRFLHLKVQNIETGSGCNLLFTDISGEHFKQLSNNSDESKKFKMCKRADHFVLFLDVELLCNPDERHQTKTDALAILRSLIEAEVLTPVTPIQVVFSKWDLLEPNKDKSIHMPFIELIEEEIKVKYPASDWNTRFFRIASRPHYTSPLAFGFGIEPLLKIWAEESQFINEEEVSIDFSLDVTNSKREYIKYAMLENL